MRFSAIGNGSTKSNATMWACAICVAFFAILITLCSAPAADASGEYEPNDSFNRAYGPIQAGTPVSGTMETSNDEDIYYFYVPRRAQLSFSFSENDDEDSYLCAEIYQQTNHGPDDVSGTYLETQNGETVYAAVTVPRGKYYVKVDCAGAIGEGYTFLLGPTGATTTYEALAAGCLLATTPADSSLKKLRKSKAALKRARKNHRRKAVRRAKARTKKNKATYSAALAAQDRACSVPK